MNVETGEIVSEDYVKELIKAGDKKANFYKMVPEALHSELSEMNRKQRRTFYSQNKHLFKNVEP